MDVRYFAGLFDGEGYIRIARWKKPNSTHVRYCVYCGIAMTHRPIIEAFRDRFGGRAYTSDRHKQNPKRAHWKIYFVWAAGSQIAVKVLEQLEPHLVVKREEAHVALELQRHIDSIPYVPLGRGKGRFLTDEQLAYRESLFQQITALKQRAFSPLTD